MQITKILYFIESPFDRRDYERLGVEVFIKNGFEVYVWDFSPLLNPEICHIKVSDPITYEKYRRFLTKKEALSSILKESQGSFVVNRLRYGPSSFFVYKALSKNRTPYSVPMSNAVPSIAQKPQSADVLKKILRVTPRKLINYVFWRIPHRCLGVRSACFNLAGGELSTKYPYPVGSSTETLWLHTMDYDIYLRECHKLVQTKKNLGVFLDEYFPFHRDYLMPENIPKPATSEKYYPSLCNFFDFLEENYGVCINIAAHPRSKYEEYPDYFGGRRVIRGKTAQMVKESEFVIAHSSTSLNFAVLFGKPVIFITTKELQQSSYQGPFIKLMASWFGKLPINIDNPIEIDWDKELTVDKKAYSKYKNCYIKKNGSEELPFWQVVSNQIKALKV